MEGHEVCGVYVAVGVCDHPLEGLEFGDWFAELAAFEGVAHGFVEAGAGDADGLRGDADAAAVEGYHGDFEAFAFAAEEVCFGDGAVLECEGCGAGGAEAHLFFVGADDEAGCAALDDEG